MAKKDKDQSKPGAAFGFGMGLLFALLQIVSLHTGLSVFTYLSVVPAGLLLFWFIARIC